MAAPDLSVPTLFNVKGKIALVTGGGSGLGTMMASALVQNGAKVYIASRKEKQLKEVTEALNKQGPGTCSYIVADLSSKAGCDALCDAFKAKESKLHILVNNSGATWGAPFNDFPEKNGWDKIMSLNVKSIFYMTANLADYLEKDATPLDPGRVVNISSTASIGTVSDGSGLAGDGHGLWSYHTSKAAVNHLTANLASTLSTRHITVNAILPGVFPSKMTAFGLNSAMDAFLSAQPMGRVGQPSDIGGVLLFLVSPAASHVTNAAIVVDGGQLVKYGAFARL
ncbi:probable NADPH-dependent beta-ketoacyl reductase (rhlG) [Serendipita indica DSM 11827]|uniref:Probable NADPH-dependent beta-ketoacyl reductase (RhlG) n=1 Tax=Serendipita indica (strain DSM 11827) TaxID=1109443 RepID=G4TM49_SERID|nr:probable NADPH-dependent beta-ketoacyl reductase (rhlG) [Serendipita indica DSM 11827]